MVSARVVIPPRSSLAECKAELVGTRLLVMPPVFECRPHTPGCCNWSSHQPDFDKPVKPDPSVELYSHVNRAWVRAAMIEAARLKGFNSTRAKLSFFVRADEQDVELLPIQGTSEVRVLGRILGRVRKTLAWRDWRVHCRIIYDVERFSVDDISALLTFTGEQIGVGFGHYSTNSASMGWGLFKVVLS